MYSVTNSCIVIGSRLHVFLHIRLSDDEGLGKLSRSQPLYRYMAVAAIHRFGSRLPSGAETYVACLNFYQHAEMGLGFRWWV